MIFWNLHNRKFVFYSYIVMFEVKKKINFVFKL